MAWHPPTARQCCPPLRSAPPPTTIAAFPPSSSASSLPSVSTASLLLRLLPPGQAAQLPPPSITPSFGDVAGNQLGPASTADATWSILLCQWLDRVRHSSCKSLLLLFLSLPCSPSASSSHPLLASSFTLLVVLVRHSFWIPHLTLGRSTALRTAASTPSTPAFDISPSLLRRLAHRPPLPLSAFCSSLSEQFNTPSWPQLPEQPYIRFIYQTSKHHLLKFQDEYAICT